MKIKNVKTKEIPASLCLNPYSKLNTCLIEQIFSPNPGHICTRKKTSNESKYQDKVTTILRSTQPQTMFFNSNNFSIDRRPWENLRQSTEQCKNTRKAGKNPTDSTKH